MKNLFIYMINAEIVFLDIQIKRFTLRYPLHRIPIK